MHDEHMSIGLNGKGTPHLPIDAGTGKIYLARDGDLPLVEAGKAEDVAVVIALPVRRQPKAQGGDPIYAELVALPAVPQGEGLLLVR